jgi:hypothetical protein
MTLFEEYASQFLTRPEIDRYRDLLLRAQYDGTYDWTLKLHREWIEFIDQTISRKIEQILERGQIEEAEALRRFKSRVLNGFEWNPSHRRTHLIFDPNHLQAQTAREQTIRAHSQEVRVRFRAPLNSGNPLAPNCSPLHRVLSFLRRS